MTRTSDIGTYRELFAPRGAITTRPMMGGSGFYADARLFATIHGDGRLYLRTKGPLAERLAGSRPSNGKVSAMGYWSLPDDALDDPERACELARAAFSEG